MTELEIFKKCISLGMTPAGAAGCTANILTESAGKPNNVEDRSPMSDEEYTAAVDNGSYDGFREDRLGYGLFQFTLPSRKEKYLAYFKGQGVSIGDAKTQFQFMAREMREDYPYVWSILTHTASPYEAGAVMCRQYERPQDVEASAEARGKLAETIYQRCKNAEVKSVYYNPQKVIDQAYSQVGYHEKNDGNALDNPSVAGDGNWTKYARDLDAQSGFYNGKKQGFAWCDVFVDWCFVQAYGRAAAQFLLCQPDNSLGAGCSFSAQYFNAKGQFHKKDPKPGDQIFFGRDWNDVWHTGIVVEVTASRVVTIEGNTSDQVAKRSYALNDSSNDSSIFGYGRPRWGNPEDGEADSTPALTPTPGQKCRPELPILKKGSEGGYVKCLQRQLIEMGYDCGNKKLIGKEKPDGEFGDATDKAVKAVQKKHGLLEDGEVGEDTWPYILNY